MVGHRWEHGAKYFGSSKSVSHLNLTGLVITKLDGAAKGGIVFSIAKELNLPIYFVGLGEGVEDLQRFNAQLFVDALLYE